MKHIFASLCEFISFSQKTKKTLPPIDSSTFGDILIITKTDVYFTMTKKHVFQFSCSKHVERRVSRHFKAHIELRDDQNVTRS